MMCDREGGGVKTIISIPWAPKLTFSIAFSVPLPVVASRDGVIKKVIVINCN